MLALFKASPFNSCLLKADGDDDGGFHAFIHTFLHNWGHRILRYNDNCQVNGARYCQQVWVSLVPQNVVCTAVDRVYRCLWAGADKPVEYEKSPLGRRGRSADYGDGVRIEKVVHRI